MPFQADKISLASIVCGKEIRVYRSIGGLIVEASLDLDTIVNNNYSAARWNTRAVDVDVICAPGSDLCCVAWGNSVTSLLYQTSDGHIRELRRDSGVDTWTSTNFPQALNAMPGTQIAVVHTENSDRVVMFFQDNVGYVCYLLAIDGVWELSPANIDMASPSAVTPIAAVRSGLTGIRLWYQNYDFLKLGQGTFHGGWTSAFSTQVRTLNSMAVVSWLESQARLYLQVPDGSLRELNPEPDAFHAPAEVTTGLPSNGAVSALVLTTSNGYSIYLFYVTADQNVKQRFGLVDVSDTAVLQWSPENVTVDFSLASTATGTKPTTGNKAFPKPGKCAIAATVCSGAVRAFYCGEGHIREACLTADAQNQSSHAQVGSANGALDEACATGSSLCGVSWGASDTSLFYQTADGVIRQTSQLFPADWKISSFEQMNAIPGTHMAEVHTQNADHVMIFFQDEDDFLCCRRAVDWAWEPSVRLGKADKYTLTAATLSDTEQIYIYFQVGGSITEYSSSFDPVNWVLGAHTYRPNKPLTSLAVVSWPGRRLYMQADDGSLEQLSWDPDFGHTVELSSSGLLSDCDISAVVQNSSVPYSLYLYYVDSAKSLQQRIGTTQGSGSSSPVDVFWLLEILTVDLKLSESDTPTHKVFPNPHKLAIAAATAPGDIRVYYCAGGQISEAVLSANDDGLDFVYQDTTGPLGTSGNSALEAVCASGSSLCCISCGVNILLFYQTGDGIIHELQKRPSQEWNISDFEELDALPGTYIAEVHSENTDDIMIFFQDEAEFLCSRRAVNGVWQPAVRLWKAERETPIAATMLSDSKIMHVFFQVGNNIVVYLGSFDGNWVQGFFDIPVPKTFSSMAAVSWPAGSWPGPQIRLYMQAQDGSIMEISRGPHDSGRYTGLITVGLGLPNVDISVFWRWGPSLGSSIYLYYLNDAKILQQAVGKTKLPDWPPPDAKAIVSWVPRSTTLDLTHLSAVETGSNGGTGRIHINLAGTDLANDSNSTAPTTQYNPSPQHRPMAIAGTRWPAGIRVYAQTGDGVIREGCLDESTQWDQAAQAVVLIESWQRGLPLPDKCAPWSTLYCVSWGQDSTASSSVFYQTHDNVLHEMCHDAKGWTVSGFTQAGAMPGTAISAVHNTNAHDMLLFFQDSSGFLCYRLAVNLVWEDSVCLCKAATGTPITATTWNNAMDIRLYFQDTSNQLRELYTTLDDGWHGTWTLGNLKMSGFRSMAAVSRQGPHIDIYAQQDDNSVTQLSCSGDFLYLAMPLNTGSNGILENTAISAFGVPTASDMNAHLYWANVDKILQQRVISHNLWSPATVVGDLASCEPLGDHTGVVTPLDQLVAQAKVVSDSITAIVQENAALAASVTTLSGSLTSELHVPAEEAVAGMKVLALSVEALSKASGSDSAPLVKRCKGQSVTVAHRFDVLYTKAHAMLGDGTNLATDITYQESVVQLKITRVEAIRKQAQVLQQGDEKLIKEYETEIQSLQSQIGFIEQAKQHARAAMTETEGIRIVRDIFTLGLGEIGDWGGLNEAIHYADTQIGMCNTEIADTQADIATAQSAIDGIKVELGHFADLKTQLDGFDPILQAQTTILLPMATHITEIENKALDLATALSKLAAEGDVLFVQHKARQLAGSVVAIEQWMGTSSQLSGVFIDNPESMDATLEAIAKSPVKHDAADEML